MYEDLLDMLAESASIKDKKVIHSMSDVDKYSITNAMISKLYASGMVKSHLDFEHIPDSKGDITKYTGYKSMMDVIEVLKEISLKSNIKIKELEIVETAIHNIVNYRSLFEKGFLLEKEFVIMLYNSLVYACSSAVSLLVASYVDFVKKPDRIEFSIVNTNMGPHSICIDNLDKFNLSVKKGDFAKSINYILVNERENFLGGELIIPVLIVGGIVLLVPIIREVIFYFYYSRMKVSDLLKQQMALLEINKANVQANTTFTATRKKEIMDKQQAAIKRFESLNDMVKINHSVTQTKSMQELKEENSSWKLSEVQPNTDSESSGFKLL
jgi:hypothetical protein